jgi:hypothetical protein
MLKFPEVCSSFPRYVQVPHGKAKPKDSTKETNTYVSSNSPTDTDLNGSQMLKLLRNPALVAFRRLWLKKMRDDEYVAFHENAKVHLGPHKAGTSKIRLVRVNMVSCRNSLPLENVGFLATLSLLWKMRE